MSMKKPHRDKAIEKFLHFHGGTDDKAWLQSSVKHYLETGKISGSFYKAISEAMDDYAFIEKHLFQIQLKTKEAKEILNQTNPNETSNQDSEKKD